MYFMVKLSENAHNCIVGFRGREIAHGAISEADSVAVEDCEMYHLDDTHVNPHNIYRSYR
jgi:hypothetical protein